MKYLPLAAFCVTLVLLAAVILAGCASTQPEARVAAGTATPTWNPASTPDLMHMPTYPGATDITVEYQESFGATSMTLFETHDRDAKVLAYYASLLPAQGWSCVTDDKDHNPAGTYHWNVGDLCDVYSWIAKPGDMNSKFSFDLEMMSEALEQGVMRWHFYTRRWPDSSKIPLFPNAKQVEVTYNEDKEYEQVYLGHSAWESLTTSVTDASPGQVEAFYKAALAPPDWAPNEGATSISSKQGIGFHYQRDLTRPENRYRGGGITITTEPYGNGLTQVRLDLRDTELRPPSTAP